MIRDILPLGGEVWPRAAQRRRRIVIRVTSVIICALLGGVIASAHVSGGVDPRNFGGATRFCGNVEWSAGDLGSERRIVGIVVRRGLLSLSELVVSA